MGLSRTLSAKKVRPLRCTKSPSSKKRLTFLSNVVAYTSRPSSTKDRHDVHQHRRLNRRGAIGGRRAYHARGLPSARSWPSNDRRKGRKPRIRRKNGPCPRRREAAETG